MMTYLLTNVWRHFLGDAQSFPISVTQPDDRHGRFTKIGS